MSEMKYSNAIEVQMQLFDAQLKFDLRNNEGAVMDSTTIIISPQHMKVLCNMLSDAVGKYEKEFGAISIPGAVKIN